MDEARATQAPPRVLHAQTLAAVLGALIVTVVAARMSAGYATCAAILIAGTGVLILWTPDELLPAEHTPALLVRAVLARLRVSPREWSAALIAAPMPGALVVGSLIPWVVLALMDSFPALFAVAGAVTLAAAATVPQARLAS